MLVFNLKKEWFEKIKSGEKTHEYRACGEHWDKRVLKIITDYAEPDEKEIAKCFTRSAQKTYSNFSIPVNIPCCFCLGYPKKDDKERIIYGKIRHIWLSNNKLDNLNSDLHTEHPIYDFEFELI